jgi:hypothetical protein
MKLVRSIVLIPALMGLFAGTALAEPAAGQAGAMPDHAARCAENPQKCEEMKARMQEKCAQNPERCEKMKARMTERKAWCDANPDACKKKREEMKAKRAERHEQCKANPEACKKKIEERRERREACRKNPESCGHGDHNNSPASEPGH